ncbi:MAG: ribonuclease E/G [Rhodospirillales bacterium]|nr:ribonuclease E/G [Rhodospirillales bacterium]
MTKRMLIDATHAEETRVVVLDGSQLEDYDVETATKKQLKGNIYLAKVVRVEPSLQAAFVEYGGNRHGFLAFAEIHPDYYQIPVADRQKLLAMQEAEARAAEEAEEAEEARGIAAPPGGQSPDDADAESAGEGADLSPLPEEAPAGSAAFEVGAEPSEAVAETGTAAETETMDAAEAEEAAFLEADPIGETPPPETVGGEAESTEDLRPPRIPPQFLRQYKIQEVIHRRQILLVQVVKEERGAKGAALTTYISLAGRYCVLMPNSPRGGGVSRKITSPADRRRLKEISAELSIPPGMGLIVRTAGANRPKPEIRRDCEYLLRLWDEIRGTVMKSVAPALIYEEASLIKRAIRDVYSRDIEEVLVDGEQGWQAARDFMRTLMPTHARKVQIWKDTAGRSLFSRERVEAELDRILSPNVPLRSGGSLVINQTEALVAIDVNSGRATRERNIEETALRTNLEAAEEAARQLRLRDLAGLIVIDFIDMEARKHNAMVERRLKDALKNDRARVQVGRISHFGLLEMSRQRLRPSLTETSFSPCPQCGGTGHVRSVESAAIHLLRLLEDEASQRGGELRVHASSPVALYILNHKRNWLNDVEARHGLIIGFSVDDAQPISAVRIERIRAAAEAAPPPPPRAAASPSPAEPGEGRLVDARGEETPATTAFTLEPAEPSARTSPEALPAGSEATDESEESERHRRRRRRRRRHRDDAPPLAADAVPPEQAEQPEIRETSSGKGPEGIDAAHPHARAALRERGRLGSRSGRRGEPRSGEAHQDSGRLRPAERPLAAPALSRPSAGYPAGPTPANPFADAALDLFDAIEAAAEGAAPEPRSLPPALAVAGSAAAAPTKEVHGEAPPVDDRPPAPAVKPIVLGSDEAVPTEKKRGWWQR